MNVLLTCAGRRNYLVDYFKMALDGSGRVFAADNSDTAPALQVADGVFIVPAVNDSSYIEKLLSICKRNKIQLVISLNDLELPVLAENKDCFNREGIVVVVSNSNVISTCFDKWATFNFAQKNNINVPQTFLAIDAALKALETGSLAFPVVVKPRWGTASISIEVCRDLEELTLAYELTRKRLPHTMLAGISSTDPDRSVLIQEMLCGAEYGLDVINDLDGRYACTFVKRKIAMRAGETDRAITTENSDLRNLGRKIGECLKHVGNLDCDIFATDGGYYLLEMNPRFGGGYPFSQMAGANIPAALIAWAEDRKPDPTWFQVAPGVTASKYDKLIVVK